MKIDRSRFLVLTGALSAATALATGAVVGCSSSGATNGGSPDASTTPSDSGTDGTTTTDASDAGSDTGVVACLDDRSTSADDAGDGGLDCDLLVDAGCAIACGDVFTNLKAGVALEAAQCLLKLPTCNGTATDVVAECVDKAGAKACSDPTAVPYCQSVAAACTDAGVDPDAGDGGYTQADCVKLATALNGAGRATFLSCMVESAGAGCADPPTCVSQMKH